jgi:hypothetical protein
VQFVVRWFCSGQRATITPHRSPKFSERIVTRQIRPRIINRQQFGKDCWPHRHLTLVSSTPFVPSPTVKILNHRGHRDHRVEAARIDRQFGPSLNPATDRDSE